VALQVAEQHALSSASPEVFAAIIGGASQLIQLWKTLFGFMQMGVMAMIGATRTHSQSAEDQDEADRKTGKIFQVAVVVALFVGILTCVLTFALFEPFMVHLFGIPIADVQLVTPYVNIVAPTLAIYFVHVVCSALCLQTGGLFVVGIDVLLDAVLGLVLFLSWAKNATSTNGLIERVAYVNMMLPIFKIFFYLVYISCQASRFHLFDFSAPEDMPLSKIGMDLVWQWVTSLCTVGVNQLISILTNQVSSIGFVGLMAFNYASKITAIPGAIFAWYIVMFGSRYVGDHRYEQFWGLNRTMLAANVIVAVLAIVVVPRQLRAGVGIMSNPSDEAAVSALVDNGLIGGLAVSSTILQMFTIYLSNCLVAWTQFKRQAWCNCISVLCTLPVIIVAYDRKSFDIMILGQTVLPFSALVALLVAWFWCVLPEAETKRKEHAGAAGDPETKALLAKEAELEALQDELYELQVIADGKYLKLSETMGWNASEMQLARRQTHIVQADDELPADYDNENTHGVGSNTLPMRSMNDNLSRVV
jgi:hypothetical protein